MPGWSAYYLDYKFLKKIISSLAANRPASEAAALAQGLRPGDPHAQAALDPPLFSGSGNDQDRGPDFRAHKAAFFFKLERELEKVRLWLIIRGLLTTRCTDQRVLSSKGGRVEAATGNTAFKTASSSHTWPPRFYQRDGEQKSR